MQVWASVALRARDDSHCAATGLRLVADSGVNGYQVGKNEYAALSAPCRDAGTPSRKGWNRYDPSQATAV